MARTRRKLKGRADENSSFIALPRALVRHPNWLNCGGSAIKLVCHLACQYNGFNNGDLSAPLSSKPGGITSSDTLNRAIQELEHYGLVIKTRQGGQNSCSLFALTWRSIDQCDGKLEVSSTKTAPGDWKVAHSKFRTHKKKVLATENKGTPYGFRSSGCAKVVSLHQKAV